LSLAKKFLFFLTITFSATFLFSNSYTVKIGLKENIKKFKISLNQSGATLIIKSSSGKVTKLKPKSEIEVRLMKDDKVQILGKTYSLPFKFFSKKGIKIDNKIFPGEIEVFLNKNGTLTIVNILDIEKYLYGVLPYEIDTGWTEEMLKVQAVIARTYTIANLGRHKEDGYDLCSSVHCQVYKGISKNIHKEVKKAVDETLGLIVVDKNDNLAQTYYHAACGGVGTENVLEIWSGVRDFEYLRGVECSYCKNSPYSKWRCVVSQDKLVKLLLNNGYDLKKIVDIEIISFTKNERAKEIKIKTDKGDITMKSEELRKIIGYNNLRSTKINEIKFLENNIIFYGSGWGHGIGLCQWGANELTKQGKSFKEVIEYYYPKTKIKKLY